MVEVLVDEEVLVWIGIENYVVEMLKVFVVIDD